MQSRLLPFKLGSFVWLAMGVAGIASSAAADEPPSLSLHSAIYDPVRQRMVVFGGNDGASGGNQVWVLTLGNDPKWRLLLTSGAPPAKRFGHTAIYDPVGDRMIVFGGFRDPFGGLADLWSLSLADSTWNPVQPTGPVPPARYYHSAIYDSHQNRMIVFGGTDGIKDFSDVWSLSLTSTMWDSLNPTGTVAGREQHSAVYDPLGDRMLVFDGSITYDNIMQLSLGDSLSWTELHPSGQAPTPRSGHSAIYDPEGDQMIVFGGKGSQYPDDVWQLSLGNTLAWSHYTLLPFLRLRCGESPYGGFRRHPGRRYGIRYRSDLGSRSEIADALGSREAVHRGVPDGAAIARNHGR